VRTFRSAFGEIFRRGAGCLEELQRLIDARTELLLDRLNCPVTGTSVREAWQAERTQLQPLPVLSEPFDVVVTRKVHRDCLVSFEGRRYSVPFRWVGRLVDVWGTQSHVVIRAESEVIARHARHTRHRLLIDPDHYEGPSTDRVERPTPLGCVIRPIPSIRSGAMLPPVPDQSFQRFRSIPSTRSGHGVQPFRRIPSTPFAG
jgi:hypothetical protein